MGYFPSAPSEAESPVAMDRLNVASALPCLARGNPTDVCACVELPAVIRSELLLGDQTSTIF